MAPLLQASKLPQPPPGYISTDFITFRHPHYEVPYNVLLVVPRTDPTEQGFGVHHGTALVACQIIGNNAFETGQLALDANGEQLVTLPHDDVLLGSAYYFIVDGPYNLENPYPVVPTFQDWTFPHNRLPASWPPASGPPMTSCGISAYTFPVESAHLVPQKQGRWYAGNGMSEYTDLPFANIDNLANRTPLRRDIQYLFDDRALAIVPKNSTYVSHIMSTRAENYWPEHHNVAVQGLHRHARAYLFARFAWTVLFSMKSFVCTGVDRYVIQVSDSKTGRGTVSEATWVKAADLVAKYSGGSTQEAGPASKRQKTQDGLEGDGTSDCSFAEDDINAVYSWNHDHGQKPWPSDSTAPAGPNDEDDGYKGKAVDRPNDGAM
ncbi:hypothetical protein GGS23DRAFT_565265 [Durotheca rogersii]|uniref:uncharacterized protein n=1 Tax=Durotheca rogersii TaxID=419775 RepID=UPI00221FA4A0|nr:uncharacterized protein GGS23DRAFT_565265 [Durotheca rogersii]KAI5863769.1 hypothetical protein GGS23DRAFT_565265 [Durotheca rogersii]